jgi:DNA-binding FadR family transcriptional regulator
VGGQLEPFREADLAFHIACLNAAHNDFLLPLANAIRSAMMRSLRVTNRDPQRNRVSLSLHRNILDAIERHDPDAAVTCMEYHLDDTETLRRAAAGRQSDNAPTTQEEMQ